MGLARRGQRARKRRCGPSSTKSKTEIALNHLLSKGWRRNSTAFFVAPPLHVTHRVVASRTQHHRARQKMPSYLRNRVLSKIRQFRTSSLPIHKTESISTGMTGFWRSIFKKKFSLFPTRRQLVAGKTNNQLDFTNCARRSLALPVYLNPLNFSSRQGKNHSNLVSHLDNS